MRQDQFLDVIDRDEAERRFRSALDLRPLDAEEVPLDQLLGRVLAGDVLAPVDVPSFDRSNVDGYAVRAEDVYGCSEESPARLGIISEPLVPGIPEKMPTVVKGSAVPLATGAMVPRGANAVVMVEYTDLASGGCEPPGQHSLGGSHPPLAVLIKRPVTPGTNITCAGTDIGLGETVLRQGELLGSRETGVLAALGLASASVVRRPRVAVVSTGDELIAPAESMRPGLVHDSNGTILADAVRELGGEPVALGIVPDDAAKLERVLRQALACDAVLLSGGTSKGVGDLSYHVVRDLGPPGILVHGVALKPGKPLCLAAVQLPNRRPVPVVVLPGFPTSAIFTFREFVAPVLRMFAGRPPQSTAVVQAQLPFRVSSERGRTEYLLVGLVQADWAGNSDALRAPRPALRAYPMGKGSGSVTAFSRADGFVIIPRQREFLDEGEAVEVHRIDEGPLRLPDLVVIGSHCTGLDYLLGLLAREGIRSKVLAVGSMGGLAAARRGECDLAGIHLLDPESGVYNRPFVGAELQLLPGYGRLQGIVFRPGDARFEGRSVTEAVGCALADPDCVLVNRNRGSGTRVLIDQLLAGAQPAGYWTEARSHNAVVAAIAQSRADWGVALVPLARVADLAVLPLVEERYDFAVPFARWDRPAVVAFRQLLERQDVRKGLEAMGFRSATSPEH
jgi:putative molybdopterin biosynthesis protein